MDLPKQEEIRHYFDQMYQRGTTPWVQHPPEPSLKYFMDFLKKEKSEALVLDLGCGVGWISFQLAKYGFHVVGIDGSETAISQAKESAGKKNFDSLVKFYVGDVLDLPSDLNQFDALVDRGLFHHILPENRDLYFENIKKVLKPGAFVYLSVFSLKNPEGIGQRFSKKDIEKLFKNFNVEYYNEDPEDNDAPAHLMHFIPPTQKTTAFKP